ncbi:MAG: glycosyltransferase [Kiritimatiellia bacterium]|nr:glycosyltransferase [Kiritimatiellia bacterium]MDD4173316.1 glycosyltransferase [Kiritimatiellia bacterium]MDD4440335.1 glycosyltransferase [Kiritimatiellia bacterium]MDX9792342.1 glycosyltransferase [Kiritimatiellia bacterium]NLC81459.1 glycosyltransferase family 4 protein [Lentisphaerota bacterium]
MKTVLQVLEATEGGTRRHLRDLVGALDPAAFRCALAVSCRRDPDFQADLAAWRARGLAVTELAMRRGVSPFADLAALAGLVGCVRRVRPDLIHAHSAKAGALARAAGALCRVPVVYTPHAFPFLMEGGPRRRAFYRWVERLARRGTAVVIAVSREEEAAALALGYARERVVLIPNGVAPCEAGEVVIRDTAALRVGFVGRLTRQKGPDLLLDAMQEVVVHLPHVRVVFYGDGPMAAPLRARAEQGPLANPARFAGPFAQSDAVSLLRGVDVAVVPSRWEGCPYVLLEAFQAGVPVVAAAVGGVIDLVRHGENGLCVPPEDPEALGDALLTLLRDAVLRRKLAEQGRATLAALTLAQMVSRVEQVYRGVCGEPPTAAAAR